VKGPKIHALVDTQGLPLRVVVHSASLQDRDGAALVLDKIAAVAKVPSLCVEIVKRSDDMEV
jgi:transposase